MPMRCSGDTKIRLRGHGRYAIYKRCPHQSVLLGYCMKHYKYFYGEVSAKEDKENEVRVMRSGERREREHMVLLVVHKEQRSTMTSYTKYTCTRTKHCPNNQGPWYVYCGKVYCEWHKPASPFTKALPLSNYKHPDKIYQDYLDRSNRSSYQKDDDERS